MSLKKLFGDEAEELLVALGRLELRIGEHALQFVKRFLCRDRLIN